jgi:hypothetical protein
MKFSNAAQFTLINLVPQSVNDQFKRLSQVLIDHRRNLAGIYSVIR